MAENAARKFIAVIDYGAGNIRSVVRALEHVLSQNGIDMDVNLTSKSYEVGAANRIVLPGQGAFGDCMSALGDIPDMIDAISERVVVDKAPFLGICVGMQLLATVGLEHGSHKGLDWISGKVVPIPPKADLKIPHMGWNEVDLTPVGTKHPMFEGIKSGEHFYFVHSFMMECENKSAVLANTDYGAPFACAVACDNIVGVQFHPEKSQNAGLAMLDNFTRWQPT